MNFYPKGHFKKVAEISYEYLKENDIKGLILDVDNTLIDYYKNLSDDTINWVKDLKQNGIKLYILSNSNKKEKVENVAQKLELEYTYFGMKPLKRGFKKAQKMLDIPNENIAVVGDQIFTDVIGANRMRMHSILVEPIEEKDILITLLKRPIENYIKKKYMEGLPSKSKISNKEMIDSIKNYKVNTKKVKTIEENNGKKDRNVSDTKEERDVF